MTIGLVGLGNMGKQITLHLLEQGVSVVGYNRSPGVTDMLAREIESDTLLTPKNDAAFFPKETIEALVQALPRTRIIWIMVKAGLPVDQIIDQLIAAGIEEDDVIIDGGNSWYKDSVRRHELLKTKGVHFIDVGLSGGLKGARSGSCLMIGGEPDAVAGLNDVWESVAQPGGFKYFGPSGAGHFVKMVHNGIEYGMDQAIAEGFDVLKHGPYELDLTAVADNWNNGSIVRGHLMELLREELTYDPALRNYRGVVGGGETGTWMREVASQEKVNVPVLDAALEARKRSSEKKTFSGQVVSALRHGYGGHEETKA